MAPAKGPIVPRKRLRKVRKRLREESGRTLDEVAQALMISTSKLSWLENAQGGPQARDLRDLVVYYGFRVEPLRRWLIMCGEADLLNVATFVAVIATHSCNFFAKEPTC